MDAIRETVIEYWLVTLLVVLFDLVLKLVTMWQSARRGQLVWFLCLALINTLGLLPLVYLWYYRSESSS